MSRLTCVVMTTLCLLAGCADMAPRPTGRCIPGDPSGPVECQAATYFLAP